MLAQVEVAGKENEIKAAPRLLEAINLRDKVVSGDAMLAQRDLSAQVVAAGGEYLWPMKANQPQLPNCTTVSLRSLPANGKRG